MKKKSPKAIELNTDEKKILEFELSSQGRRFMAQKERFAAIKKELGLSEGNVIKAVMSLYKKGAYTHFVIDKDRSRRFLDEGNITILFWVFVKLDYHRADVMHAWKGAPSEPAHQHAEKEIELEKSRTDLLLERLQADFDSDVDAVRKTGVKLLETHSLLGFYFDLALNIQAQSENALAHFLTQYLHGIPEVAHTHTVTTIYNKMDIDPEQESENGAAGSTKASGGREAPKKRSDFFTKKKAVLRFLLDHPESYNKSAETVASSIVKLKYSETMNEETYRLAVNWLIQYRYIQEYMVDYYGARYAIYGRWPVRYLIFIKASFQASKAGQNEHYQRSLIRQIESVFYEKAENEKKSSRGKESYAKGITLIGIHKLMSFEFSLVMTVLADHQDSVGDYVTGYLHSQPGITETHTVTSLVLHGFRKKRLEIEGRIAAPPRA